MELNLFVPAWSVFVDSDIKNLQSLDLLLVCVCEVSICFVWVGVCSPAFLVSSCSPKTYPGPKQNKRIEDGQPGQGAKLCFFTQPSISDSASNWLWLMACEGLNFNLSQLL